MTPQQKERYLAWRNSGKSKFRSRLRNIMSQLFGDDKVNVSAEVLVFMGSVTKMFVGEIVEEALRISGHTDDDHPPLQPHQIREAARRLGLRGRLGSYQSSHAQRLFRR
eukprot:c5616_g1_i1.p1 GENE.c5616_g1_i1~~c5616_g1_i1.p1  ORF type:complete len:109 (+),score=12.39 c5616_g1_i1:304-630(+)